MIAEQQPTPEQLRARLALLQAQAEDLHRKLFDVNLKKAMLERLLAPPPARRRSFGRTGG